MVHSPGPRAGDEHGFTLIELLLVILIVAILAAVAIPTFLSQRGKAYDSNAQSMVKNMRLAELAFATGNDGTYAANLTDLASVEPTVVGGNGVTPSVAGATGTTSYTVVATASSTGDSFTITETNGVEINTCTVGTGDAKLGSCPVSGYW